MTGLKPVFFTTILLLKIMKSDQHARMMEPPSRASMWRVGFPTPKNENDNALYCGGFGVQWQQNGGRCGICGDPWHQVPRQNEAPGGIFATGIITKTYRQGSIIPVVIDITANHQGHFTFRLCPNNDIWQDPDQDCFDRFILPTGKDGAKKFPIEDYSTGLRLVYVHLPRQVYCEQCILQWTYTAGNNWGLCSNGTGGLGCGPQENFRSCSDIRIVPTKKKFIFPSKINSFSDETTFNLDQFEDYYDQLFEGDQNDLINQVDYEERDRQPVTVKSIQTKKLKLLKKKLVLAKALKSLSNLIRLSKEDSKEKKKASNKVSIDSLDYEDLDSSPGSAESAWRPRTNSHGKKRRRKRRWSFLYDLLNVM